MIQQISTTSSSVSDASQRVALTSDETGNAIGEIARAVGDVASGAERQVQMVDARQALDRGDRGVGRRGAASPPSRASPPRRRRPTRSPPCASPPAALVAAMASLARALGEDRRHRRHDHRHRRPDEPPGAQRGHRGRPRRRAGPRLRGRRRGGPQARRGVPVGGQDDRRPDREIQGETAHVVEIVEDGAKRTDESARVVVHARDAFIKIGENVSDMTVADRADPHRDERGRSGRRAGLGSHRGGLRLDGGDHRLDAGDRQLGGAARPQRRGARRPRHPLPHRGVAATQGWVGPVDDRVDSPSESPR